MFAAGSVQRRTRFENILSLGWYADHDFLRLASGQRGQTRSAYLVAGFRLRPVSAGRNGDLQSPAGLRHCKGVKLEKASREIHSTAQEA